MNAERRRNVRLRPENLTFVAVRPKFAKLGKLLDISSSGLCFQYMYKKDQNGGKALFKIDIFINENGYYLLRVPCKVIYDIEIKEEMVFTIELELRRCGLKFENLTKDQVEQLGLYLKNHAG